MPDPGVLFTAVTTTDNRLKFAVGRTPELVFQQPRLTPHVALEMAIPLVEKLYRSVDKLLKEKAAAEEAAKEAEQKE